nr:hypothetical protein [Morchella crassipes]
MTLPPPFAPPLRFPGPKGPRDGGGVKKEKGGDFWFYLNFPWYSGKTCFRKVGKHAFIKKWKLNKTRASFPPPVFSSMLPWRKSRGWICCSSSYFFLSNNIKIKTN